MKNFLNAWIVLLLLTPAAFAGKTGTWSGSTTHQFFPTITNVLLGNGYSVVPSRAFYSDGSDGAQVMGASGVTTLARDMSWTSLSWPVASTATIAAANQRIFVNGNCDFSNAPAGAINDNGGAATNGAAGGGAGSNGNTVAVGSNLTGRSGGNGGAGSTTAGAQGAVGTGGSTISGSSGGSSGAGGTGTGGAGGAARGQVVATNAGMRDITTWFLPTNGAGGQVFVGGSGPGGGGGGGDVTNSGGGGGGGGASGQTIYIACKTVTTGGSSVANTIQANGSAGGNGGTPAVGNTGGGGGGGGGAGGWIVFKYNTKVGTAVTNFIQAAAGAQGTGGTAHGTGTNGAAGATPAVAGLIQVLNLSTGAIVSTTTGTVSL